MQALQNSGGDIESLMYKIANSGSIADAQKRQQSWLVAGNIHQDQQLDDMNRGTFTPARTASDAHAQVNQALPGVPGIAPTGTYQKQDLNALRKEQDAMDARNAAAASDANRIKRNKLMGLPLNTP
jgi:hypothetical protein